MSEGVGKNDRANLLACACRQMNKQHSPTKNREAQQSANQLRNSKTRWVHWVAWQRQLSSAIAPFGYGTCENVPVNSILAAWSGMVGDVGHGHRLALGVPAYISLCIVNLIVVGCQTKAISPATKCGKLSVKGSRLYSRFASHSGSFHF